MKKLLTNFLLIFSVLSVSGCLEMEVKHQPTGAEVGSTFSATTEVLLTGNDGENLRTMLYAVNKPSGWTINSVAYTSPQHGDGVFAYLGDAVDYDDAAQQPGGLDEGWETALEEAHPSAEGMHWQLYMSDQAVLSTASEEMPDEFHITVEYTVNADAAEGNVDLTYWVSYDSNGNGALADDDNAVARVAPVIVYDPTLSPLVTFTLDDQTWLNEDVRMKGVMSNWNLFQAYDDGMHGGDATAGDHIWTAQYPVLEDGTYSWGSVEYHGPDEEPTDTWLMSGFPNPEFTVAGLTVDGATNFQLAPDMAVSEGVVEFTVTDETQAFTDMWWKGTPTDDNWTPRQMYDDGTNGDETADDHVWTIHVDNIAAGAHNWGAQSDENDGGSWVIVGGNPAFTLDDDLLTLHGQTDYVIPYLGEPLIKTVLFNVDMTEWLDASSGGDGMGMGTFNVALDEVQVRGSFNGWGDCTGCTMERTPGTNIFSLALEVEGLPNFEHMFAYYVHYSDESLMAMAEMYADPVTVPDTVWVMELDADGNETGDCLDADENDICDEYTAINQVPNVVDWIGWETSPQFEGNRNFVLGEADDDMAVMLPTESYYDAFPGSVLPAGHEMETVFSIDMSGVTDFDPENDKVMLRTHDKWLNLSQAYSNGQDLNHLEATAVGDGVYEFPVTLTGPVPWNIYYKWGYLDAETLDDDGSVLATDVEVLEAGGGLGGVPRIRYLHQYSTPVQGCTWRDSFVFPVDEEWFVEENTMQEEWNPDGVCIALMATGDEKSALPNQFSISNNYPNPFNPTTEMEFSLPIQSDITFTVYSITGQEVYSHSRNAVPSGKYQITWNGRDQFGKSLASGVYLYEFKAGNEFRQTKKMTLLK